MTISMTCTHRRTNSLSPTPMSAAHSRIFSFSRLVTRIPNPLVRASMFDSVRHSLSAVKLIIAGGAIIRLAPFVDAPMASIGMFPWYALSSDFALILRMRTPRRSAPARPASSGVILSPSPRSQPTDSGDTCTFMRRKAFRVSPWSGRLLTPGLPLRFEFEPVPQLRPCEYIHLAALADVLDDVPCPRFAPVVLASRPPADLLFGPCLLYTS